MIEIRQGLITLLRKNKIAFSYYLSFTSLENLTTRLIALHNIQAINAIHMENKSSFR
jgi:hypothetical protein